MADFIPNPHLTNTRLTVSHISEEDRKKLVKKGTLLEEVQLVHCTSRNRKTYTLGFVPSLKKSPTPKSAQHRIMCACFGSDSEGLIVRDRDVAQLFTEFLGAPFSMVSNRMLRTTGLVEHAVLEGCSAVYTPEGYDQYLLDSIQEYIHKKGYNLKLFTKMDGGLVEVC